MASFGGPSLDLDLLPGSSSSVPSLPFQPVVISDMDRSLMTDVAANAMQEMLQLLQTDKPLWMKSPVDGRDVLNLESYERNFPRPNTPLKSPNIRIEASRDSGVVIMNSLALVDMFVDPVSFLKQKVVSSNGKITLLTSLNLQDKWVELFPTIVSMAKTIQVISSAMLGNHNGSLQLVLVYGVLNTVVHLLVDLNLLYELGITVCQCCATDV